MLPASAWPETSEQAYCQAFGPGEPVGSPVIVQDGAVNG